MSESDQILQMALAPSSLLRSCDFGSLTAVEENDSTAAQGTGPVEDEWWFTIVETWRSSTINGIVALALLLVGRSWHFVFGGLGCWLAKAEGLVRPFPSSTAKKGSPL